MAKARVFTDLHENTTRPNLSSPDIYLDDGAGSLNSVLSGLTGWSGIPANIRAGWSSRSSSIGYSEPKITTLTANISNSNVLSSDVFDNAIFGFAFQSGAGGEYAFYSPNGGGSWYEITSTVTGGIAIRTIVAISETVAISVADSGDVVKFEWNGSSLSESIINTTDLEATNHDYGVLLDNGKIVVGNLNGNIYYSTDNGVTWTEATTPASGRIFEIEFLNNTTGYASCANGTLLKTTDGGVNWSQLSISTTSDIYSIYLSSNYISVIPREDDVFYSTDGGSNWSTFSSGSITINRNIYDVSDGVYLSFCLDTNSFYAVDIINESIYDLSSSLGNRLVNPRLINGLFKGMVSQTNTYTEIDTSIVSQSLKTGQDNPKRIGWFYMDESGGTYVPETFDGNNITNIVIELLNAQEQTGTESWLKWFPFCDSNGYPTSINYNLGGGVQDYCAWGIEYTNDNATGDIINQRLVLIRNMNYPASPDDTVIITVDELLGLTSNPVSVNEYSVLFIGKTQNVVKNDVLQSGDNEPNYLNVFSSEELQINGAIIDTIFSNYWMHGGIHGLGGFGSTDGNGLIDNLILRVD